MSSEKLSEHFTRSELACKCGCGLCNVVETLMSLAEQVRAVLKEPMIVHSAYRCAAHNAAVGGAPNSQHLQGKAMDFHVKGLTPLATYNAILKAHNDGKLQALGGLGLYDWGVHIDCRNNPDGRLRTWDYRSKR